jgi:type IV secretory pathway VirB10-like protein
MNRVIVSGLALLTAVTLAACQQAPASDKAAEELKAEKEKTAALEQRIADLEKKAEVAVPAPSMTTNLQAPAVAPAPLPVERRTVRRTTTTRTARKSTPASTTSPRVSVIPEERARVEDPVVRTDRTRERDPWATTGDPGPRREEIPAGTSLTLVLENGLSTVDSREGQAVTARVERAVSEDGRVVLPGGSVLRGRVSEVDPSGRVSGRAHLAVKWDTITVRGVSRRIETSDVAMTADDNHGRDAKIIGGSTAAGAIIGGIVNGGRGAKKGAIIGAGAGTGAVLINKGSEVEMASGSRWTVRVKETVRL